MASQLRYMGFDQAKNIRKYKFDGVAANETTTHFVVNADLALFFRYHVALQEGPVLCLKKLSADLEMLQPLPHELTGSDLGDHVSAQAAAAAKRITKRKRRRTERPEYYTYPATSRI
jgi:hypothetical protein